MAYALFDPTKPAAATQAGTAFGQSIIDNFKAIRDSVMMGNFPGFNMSKTGGTAEQPGVILFTKGTEIVKGTLTWGTTGGEAGNVTVAVYAYSSNSGSSYDTIGTQTMAYDASGNLTTTTWT